MKSGCPFLLAIATSSWETGRMARILEREFDTIPRVNLSDRYVNSIINGMSPSTPLSADEQHAVKDQAVKRRIRLEVRTATDVDWHTINTADSPEDGDAYQRTKLRNMWYDGYRTMFPDGTEWRLKYDYF